MMLGSLNEWNVLSNFVLMGGVVCLAGVIIFGIYCCVALEKGRAVFPWSSRARIDKSEADMKVAEHRLRLEAIAMQEMALHAKRDKLVEAIKNGEPITSELLKVPKAQLGEGQY